MKLRTIMSSIMRWRSGLIGFSLIGGAPHFEVDNTPIVGSRRSAHTSSTLVIQPPPLRVWLSREAGSFVVAFLREDKPLHVELHHFAGHDPRVLGLAHALEVPYEVVVHDYAWICPRITLVGRDRHYCGEPGGDACEACYADVGGTIEEDIRPARLRLRSRSILAGARRIVAPSHDAATRLEHYFAGLRCEVTPWESDATRPPAADRRISRLRLRV